MRRYLLAILLAVLSTFLTGTADGGGAAGGAVKGAVKPAERPRFFIVAPEQFHAALKDYVAHKNQRFATELISLEKTLKRTAGVDDPERLKRAFGSEMLLETLTQATCVGADDPIHRGIVVRPAE